MARKRTIPRPPSLGDLLTQVEEYLLNRSMRERSEHHEGMIKRGLMGILEVAGEQRTPTSQVLEFDQGLPYTQYKAGKPVQKVVTGIERRKRTSNVMDEEKAMALIVKKGLTGCIQTVQVLDEDALLAANYAGSVTDKELAALYTESETYAFYLMEGTTES